MFQIKIRGFNTFARSLVAAALTIVFILAAKQEALAIPSFAAQTGQPCSACHVGAFGPQLKPYGRDFKLYGYVTSDRPKDNFDDNWPERFSMMMKTGFTNTTKDQASAPADGAGLNNNITYDQAALYYGGRITSDVGALQEMSYDGINHKFFWDAMDVRHAWEGTILGTDYVGGILASNQLGNTSLWNSTPPNAFPYNASGVAPAPTAGTLFDDSLNGQILGAGAYISWNSWLYAETTLYNPLNLRTDQFVGNPSSNKYDGLIPFWHIAVEHSFFNNEHYFQLGTFGATADRYPGTSGTPIVTVGPKDHLTDAAAEANYQWLADMHNMISAHATYVRENQDLNGSAYQGFSSNTSDHLNTFRADLTYTIDDTYVPTVQYFRTTGSSDTTLYSSPYTSSGSPNSEGYTIDLAYVPFGKPDSPGYNWGNARLALQYTGYTEFNGTSKHAEDNNTIFLNFWFVLDPLVPALGNSRSASSASTAH